MMRVGDIADGPTSPDNRSAFTFVAERSQSTTHRARWSPTSPSSFPKEKNTRDTEVEARHDCDTTLSLCPLGRPAASYDADGVRFPSAESSCEREKKSSSPSYGDGPEFI